MDVFSPEVFFSIAPVFRQPDRLRMVPDSLPPIHRCQRDLPVAECHAEPQDIVDPENLR